MYVTDTRAITDLALPMSDGFRPASVSRARAWMRDLRGSCTVSASVALE